MAKLIYQDGDIVKEWETQLDAEGVETRLALMPYEIEIDEGVTAVVFAHPDVIEMACKKRTVSKETDAEKVKKLLELLDESLKEDEDEDEDETEEPEEDKEKTHNELMTLLKGLSEAVAELRKEVADIKGEKSAKQPMLIKSQQAYERVAKFEKEQNEGEQHNEPSHLTPFQRALLKEWGVL